jgi:hypothetical protein
MVDSAPSVLEQDMPRVLEKWTWKDVKRVVAAMPLGRKSAPRRAWIEADFLMEVADSVDEWELCLNDSVQCAQTQQSECAKKPGA